MSGDDVSGIAPGADAWHVLLRRQWEVCYQETARAEAAEAEVERLRATLDEAFKAFADYDAAVNARDIGAALERLAAILAREVTT